MILLKRISRKKKQSIICLISFSSGIFCQIPSSSWQHYHLILNSDLQIFLKDRGVTYAKLKESDAVELCNLAHKNNLETDPIS